MRRRREDILADDIKSVLGKILFTLFKGLVKSLIKMLKDKGWVKLDGEYEYD